MQAAFVEEVGQAERAAVAVPADPSFSGNWPPATGFGPGRQYASA
jgi:hypothetical protein